MTTYIQLIQLLALSSLMIVGAWSKKDSNYVRINKTYFAIVSIIVCITYLIDLAFLLSKIS